MNSRREYIPDRDDLPGRGGSTWLAEAERAPRPALDGDISTEVAVIGGGLCGALTAVTLAEAGARVLLVEGRRVASDVTGHSTSKLTAQHGLLTESIPESAQVPWLQANLAAVQRLSARAAGVPAAKFFRADSFAYVPSGEDTSLLDAEWALYRDAGAQGGLVSHGLPEWIATALRLEHQGALDPVGLIDGLLEAQEGEFLTVVEGTLAHEVEENRSGARVMCDGGTVTADAVVITTHTPFFDSLLYATRLFQHRHYALEGVTSELPQGMWYGVRAPELSWRPVAEGDTNRMVLSGNGSHKAGHDVDEREYYRSLEELCRERLGLSEVARHWSTQDAVTPDALPFIGKMHGRDRLFMASGFRAWGLSASEVAAEVLSALVGGGEHPLTEHVGPARIHASGLASLVTENVDTARSALTHELTKSGEPDSVQPREGTTMRAEEGHVAVYTSADGGQHVLNPHCTHMRCAVSFNEAEETWDCPCHGSRFLGDGSWLHGPAHKPLSPAKR